MTGAARGKAQERNFILAIDGPAGAGKSTVAKRLAKALGFLYMDTGAMYRALALKVAENGIEPENTEQVNRILQDARIELSERDGQNRVYLDGRDVSEQIRTPELSQLASKVSTLKAVRDKMVELQRAMGAKGGVVVEGRDIGTVVFPNAEIKIYLDASPQERARRRVEEINSRGGKANLEETLAETKERDHRDQRRTLAPLRKSEDAVVVDSTSMDINQVVSRIQQAIKARVGGIE
jgi:CMP/dCMP kinase